MGCHTLSTLVLVLPALVAVDRLSPPGDVWPPGGLGRSGRLVHCRLTRGLREGVTSQAMSDEVGKNESSLVLAARIRLA
jgi:hypothetical protein